MTIAVRLFARARDLAGAESMTVAVAPPVTVAAVRRALMQRCPALAPLGPHLLAAVNSDYASDNDLIPDRGEIAFFPPVSGG